MTAIDVITYLSRNFYSYEICQTLLYIATDITLMSVGLTLKTVFCNYASEGQSVLMCAHFSLSLTSSYFPRFLSFEKSV